MLDERSPEGLVSTAQVGSARRLARMLTVGFGFCEEDGFPLSERQQIAMLTAALLAFDGFQLETRGMFDVERLLGKLAGREPAPARPSPFLLTDEPAPPTNGQRTWRGAA